MDRYQKRQELGRPQIDVPVQYCGNEDGMAETGDGKKLGHALKESKQRRVDKFHDSPEVTEGTAQAYRTALSVQN